MRLIYTAFICFLSSISLAIPMEFITFQPSSQYYDTAITQDWAQLAFYGGRVNVHTQPKVNYTIAKNLQSSDILALGNVVFGIEPAVGYTYFKGDGNTAGGTAKSLTTVDAIVDNLYIYGAKFPSTGGKEMKWETFDVELAGGGKQNGTYLVIDTEEVEARPQLAKHCFLFGPIVSASDASPIEINSQNLLGSLTDFSQEYNYPARYNNGTVLPNDFIELNNIMPGTYYDVVGYEGHQTGGRMGLSYFGFNGNAITQTEEMKIVFSGMKLGDADSAFFWSCPGNKGCHDNTADMYIDVRHYSATKEYDNPGYGYPPNCTAPQSNCHFEGIKKCIGIPTIADSKTFAETRPAGVTFQDNIGMIGDLTVHVRGFSDSVCKNYKSIFEEQNAIGPMNDICNSFGIDINGGPSVNRIDYVSIGCYPKYYKIDCI